MELLTYSNIKEKIENDLDLIDEDFISETELLGYMNEALADAQAVIHTLGLEATYFLKNDTINLVGGTSDYAYPSDIYAMKIRKMLRMFSKENFIDYFTGTIFNTNLTIVGLSLVSVLPEIARSTSG